MIVCLEGIDACGKGTHAARLTQRLNAKHWKFPDRRTPTGKVIYDHLEEKWACLQTDAEGLEVQNNPKEESLRDALVFQSLQLANRMEVASDIFEAASKGNVVFDRYWPSAYAYGRADGLDGEYLINLHQWLPQPDLFILLDIDPTQSALRRPERLDRYEKAPGLLAQAACNYRELWLAQRDSVRWVIVDARGTVESTAAQIEQAVAAVRYQEGAA